ncbi:MAG: MMPL family transporter [Dehalococcoidia bacterium]
MSLNLSTEALARRSSRHPWITIGIWVLILIIAVALIFNFLGDALTTEQNFTNNPEAIRAFDLLEDRLRGPLRANEIVIVRSETLTVDSPAFQGFVVNLFGDIERLGSDVIESGMHYYQLGIDSLVSADRHTTILPLTIAGPFQEASGNIDGLLEIVREADGESEFQVLITGQATIGNEFQEISESDLRRGELFGIPVALAILVLVFGTIAAAIIPIVLAVLSIAVALGATALIGQVFQFSFFATTMITMIGLAVGIDYSLFIVSRYREERIRGLEKNEAIAVTGATASRTVFFSGMTVVFALMGMLIVPTTIFRSLGAGAILVVTASVLVALTLLPAVLSLMGDRVNALRVPLIQRAQRKVDEQRRGGFWDRVARGVMRYPVISIVVAAGLLIAGAIPYFDINTGFAGVSTLPDRFQSKKGFLILEEEFSFGLVTPAEIVIDGQIDSQPVQSGIESLKALLDSDAAFDGLSSLEVNDSGDLALLSIPVAGDPAGQEAIQAIRRLRNQYIPQAFSGVQADVLVTGETAFNVDFFDLTDDYMPIVFAFVLGLSFILLTVVFRSLVVPVKAIIMNLLSVGAAYGLLVLVTQKGVGADFFGFQQADTIDAWIPLFLFSVLFGLSMDYHVFLLSRIKERFDQTHDNTEAVAFGIRTTGRLITGAAFIMVAVFSGFASGDLVPFQQVGFGLAVAVFLDATSVRAVLVPASMRLLGKANWYLPKVLHWLPEVGIESRERAVTPASDN